MIVKFFVEANDKEEAQRRFDLDLLVIKENINLKEPIKIVPYWKDEKIYIIEVIGELFHNTLQKILDYFCDRWQEFGEPVDELLASKNDEKCLYMKEGYVFINIFLSE